MHEAPMAMGRHQGSIQDPSTVRIKARIDWVTRAVPSGSPFGHGPQLGYLASSPNPPNTLVGSVSVRAIR
jgi:hypothetical protein